MKQKPESWKSRSGRRSFLKQATAGLALTAGLSKAGSSVFASRRETSPPQSRSRSEPKKRRVLFNWDGDDVMDFAPAPMTREQFVQFVFEPLENSTVDAVLWCPAGGNEAAYRSKVLEPHGAASGYKYTSYSKWRRYANPQGLMKEGHDALEIIVAECHGRRLDAFASLRMNDCHDAWAPKWTWVGFKQQHPEWLQSDRKGWESALNFAIPEVRDLKLAIVQEYFDNYDLDGVELDWLRHSVHLEKGWEYRMRYVLTDYMRELRQRLGARASRRGRPIEIAIRVPETLHGCLQSGYDLPVWIEEDLFDVLILGQGQSIPPRYSDFRDLMKSRKLPIHPCVYGYGSGHTPYNDEMIRGLAAMMWQTGADGLYTFNWYPYKDFRKQLLQEVGDPSRLKGKNKHYLVDDRYLADYSYYNRMEAPLPLQLYRTRRGGGPVIPIYVADNLLREGGRPSAQLRILCEQIGAQDRLSVEFNGKTLTGVRSEPNRPKVSSSGGPPEWTGAQTWLLSDLEPSGVMQGYNQVRVSLEERNPAITVPPQVRQVEIQTWFS